MHRWPFAKWMLTRALRRGLGCGPWGQEPEHDGRLHARQRCAWWSLAGGKKDQLGSPALPSPAVHIIPRIGNGHNYPRTQALAGSHHVLNQLSQVMGNVGRSGCRYYREALRTCYFEFTSVFDQPTTRQ